jgi:LPXTG-motif cell wall-anchored protein
MSRKLVLSGVIAATALLGAGGVSAQVIADIDIPVDNVLRAPVNSVTLIATAPVPAQYQGADCVAEVEIYNQESEHEGNDLIVASGGTSGVVENFETEAFGVRTSEVALTLGATVDVSVRMGPEQISSGGIVVTIDCPQTVAPTTEPPEAVPTTTVVASRPPGGGATNPPTAAQPGDLPTTGPSGTTWAAIAATTLLGAGLGLARLARRPQ